MPELPEVETVRRQLEPALVGRTLEQVTILDYRLVQPHDRLEVAAELLGEQVTAVERRGKYLVLRFVSGRALVVHLRMTGGFRIDDRVAAASPHRRATVVLDDGVEVVFLDIRRFGTWTLLEPRALRPYLESRLGPEPLGSFAAAAFGLRLARRRAPIKAVLLDQKAIAGVGNIYADEALWRARIHPLEPAAELEPEQVRALHRAVRSALRAGIARQGATLRDYRAPDGSQGGMQDEFKVYGRDGEPCPRCGGAIAKTRVAGRGTHYCPRCQRLGAGAGSGDDALRHLTESARQPLAPRSQPS